MIAPIFPNALYGALKCLSVDMHYSHICYALSALLII